VRGRGRLRKDEVAVVHPPGEGALAAPAGGTARLDHHRVVVARERPAAAAAEDQPAEPLARDRSREHELGRRRQLDPHQTAVKRLRALEAVVAGLRVLAGEGDPAVGVRGDPDRPRDRAQPADQRQGADPDPGSLRPDPADDVDGDLDHVDVELQQEDEKQGEDGHDPSERCDVHPGIARRDPPERKRRRPGIGRHGVEADLGHRLLDPLRDSRAELAHPEALRLERLGADPLGDPVRFGDQTLPRLAVEVARRKAAQHSLMELEAKLRLRVLAEPGHELGAQQLQQPVALLLGVHESVESLAEGDALDPNRAHLVGARPRRRKRPPAAREAAQAGDEADRLRDRNLDQAPGRIVVAPAGTELRDRLARHRRSL
jgi:hypothetical protein